MPGCPRSLDDLALLVEVVARGGVTAAARPLSLRKSTVSRRLAALEDRLGVSLLERGGRGLVLTEAGSAFHAGAARIVAEARRLEDAATAVRATPQGTLRVAAPALLAELLAPVLAELLLRHPALRVEVALEQHGEPGADCDLALRLGPLADSARVARRLGEPRAAAPPGVAYVPLSPPWTSVEIAAAHRTADRSPLLSSFLAVLKEIVMKRQRSSTEEGSLPVASSTSTSTSA